MAGKFTSSTQAIPAVVDVPQHIAIIMDGNGRWARKRMMPRVAGHKRGVETVRAMVKACIARGVDYLTLFAFSSENWQRPAEEVSFLMNLFIGALQAEIGKLHVNGVRLKVVGDLGAFEPRLVALIREGEAIQKKTRKVTEDRVTEMASRATGTWDKLEQVFENRVARALNSLGVPTKDDVAQLAKRVAELKAEVEKLNKAVKPATAKPARRAGPKPVLKAVRKMAPKAAA